MCRLSCLACVAACAFVLAASAGADPDELNQTLHLDDDCATGEDDQAGCALNALQHRSRTSTAEVPTEAAASHATPDPCDANPLSRMIKAAAPECVAHCPELCTMVVVPVAAAVEGVGGHGSSPLAEMCKRQEQLACVAELRDECIALSDFTEAFGLPIPKSVDDLAIACNSTPSASAVAAEGGSAGEDGKVAAALLQRAAGQAEAQALESVLAGKEADPRCEHVGEGQRCVSTNTLIYCSAHKRLWGPGYCERRQGQESMCRMDGFGLQRGYCDDAFCRNGGAYAGDGPYCHKGNIVVCSGGGPPQVQQECQDNVYTDYSGCKVTESISCHGNFPNPYCGVDHTSVEWRTCQNSQPAPAA